MTEENKSGEGEVENEGNKDEFYLGTWKDKVAAEEGLTNMQSKMDGMGNEVGTLRKQAEFSQQMIDDLKTQQAVLQTPPDVNAPNYDQDIAEIQADMAKLDPTDVDYQRDLMDLMAKSNALSREMQHEETLSAATMAFKKELDDRDVKATHSSFYKDNPDFNTPEMQMRIKEHLAKDTTGMSDSLVAYREIQRDDAAIAAKALEEENTELKRLVELAKGTDSTGKVITKGQSPPQAKQPKATGKDLDVGMQGALDALRA